MGLVHLPVNTTKTESTTMMMAVRMSVARSESTPWMPILAKMAVSVGCAHGHGDLDGLVCQVEEVGRMQAAVMAHTLARSDERDPIDAHLARCLDQPLRQRLPAVPTVLLGKECQLIALHAVLLRKWFEGGNGGQAQQGHGQRAQNVRRNSGAGPQPAVLLDLCGDFC